MEAMRDRLRFEAHPMCPVGCWVLMDGGRLLNILTRERREFLAKFGLMAQLPAATNRILLHPDDYHETTARLQKEGVS